MMSEEQSRLVKDLSREITDREALRESEARHRHLINALPMAIYTCDREGRLTMYNHAATVLWGREPEIGKDLWCGSWKIYQPNGDPLPFDECPMAVTLRAGRPVRGQEIIIERPNGTRRHILPHPEPIYDAAGNVIGAVNMLIDITERKKADRAMAHLAAIVTSSDLAIVGKDLQGTVTSWNRAAERLFGYSAEEMIGRSVLRIIPPDRRDEEVRILGCIASGKSIESYETIRRRKDGSDVPISLTVSPIIDARGHVIGASKIARDISEQKRAERASLQSREDLRRALEFQEAVVNNMGEGLYTVNGEGCVTSMNRVAEKLFGWTSEELLGRKMHDMTHYKHRDGTPFYAEECEGLQVLRSGTVLTNHEDVFVRKDGSCFDVLYSCSPIRANGESSGLVVVFRDISAQKRADEALRDRDRALTIANDELTQQSEALSEVNNELQSFSYSVSHDLRAPMRTIDAFVRIVEEDHGARLNAEARRCLGIVKKAAGQAGELIDDLLEFSRLGRIGMDLRSVKMAELARGVGDELQTMQEDRTIHLRVLDLPPCKGDWRLLQLVWSNLLANAVKYTRPRATAQIEVGWLPDDRQPDAVVYYVKDNGVGFDMKYVHKLFGVFQRLHLKEEFEGTGVGLAIVQRIVRRHGGRVWAEGKVDGGATFFFSLRKALQ
jgi:PAS domain S-box-containing protein